ncbi:MAG TPA: tRNA uridine(34) 5-carboxymethylaminomethyl modification radical SAM/GNAT enzyme Elp3 [Thermoanaerobaculia bacterium]|nr:tRNA uridine(34) 5-carboxymethylaminomethyl modification radical SAM/GNAT enzyme Elp3 [Thermoanaerobaculia bacterium]
MKQPVNGVLERFQPERYARELSAIVEECAAADGLDDAALHRILRRHPKDGRGFFKRSELVQGLRFLIATRGAFPGGEELLRRMRMKPVRTGSGVAPVTVLTQPFPCPGRCIFCPSDVRMPKSYLSSEPGARRAAQHRFDPYTQTASRLAALWAIGHAVDKVELIVLGGTWTSYPESYQVWFVKRCFDALNDFAAERASPSRDDGRASGGRGGASGARTGGLGGERARGDASAFAFEAVQETVDGRETDRGTGYNRVVNRLLAAHAPARPATGASWSELAAAHRRNERALARCVGLSLETRPDQLDEAEVRRLRRLGATKIQIGYQSLDDEVLRVNRRGHDTAATRRAMRLLRGAGFKVQAHWMPNLHGSDPERDVRDYERIFGDPAYRPDELKVYPTSLVETAELMERWIDGSWRPYGTEELVGVLEQCLLRTPPYCRLTRVIRDIPSTDIVDGNRRTNLRETVEARLRARRLESADIRAREIQGLPVRREDLRLAAIEYDAAGSREVFLQLTTAGDRLAGFLRLSLPGEPGPMAELAGAAIVREVHVYGEVAGWSARPAGAAQHRGLGRDLMAAARERAAAEGYASLAVISAVGTREYYRRLGFVDGTLYQHLGLAAVEPRPRRATAADG